MPPRRREVELSVERELGPPDAPVGVARLSARFEAGPNGEAPDLAELRAALSQLVNELESVVGPATRSRTSSRAERGLAELVETYRPRQRELVDLLRDEGAITDGEHELLASSLAPGSTLDPARTQRPTPPPPQVEPPPSAPPITAERGLPAARPVPELLRAYQISSLRQAGAVRARRQISFAEYMALKRHFESSAASSEEAAGSRPS